MLTEGTRITWEGVSRMETGIVRGFLPHGYIVGLANGKCVIVEESSIREIK